MRAAAQHHLWLLHGGLRCRCARCAAPSRHAAPQLTSTGSQTPEPRPALPTIADDERTAHRHQVESLAELERVALALGLRLGVQGMGGGWHRRLQAW